MTTGSTKFMWSFFDLCLLHRATGPSVVSSASHYIVLSSLVDLGIQKHDLDSFLGKKKFQGRYEAIPQWKQKKKNWKCLQTHLRSYFCAFQFIPKNKSRVTIETCGYGATGLTNAEAKIHKRPSIGIFGASRRQWRFLLLILRLRNLQHKLIEVWDGWEGLSAEKKKAIKFLADKDLGQGWRLWSMQLLLTSLDDS